MKLHYFMKPLATVGRLVATTLFCVATIAVVWQGAFSTPAALAAPSTLIAANVGNQVEKAADDVRAGSKNLIRDTKAKVEKTANKNAAKVDQADDKGTAVERKAKRDRNRIEQRAEDHAARTEKAVDKSMNAVQEAVENIKDALR